MPLGTSQEKNEIFFVSNKNSLRIHRFTHTAICKNKTRKQLIYKNVGQTGVSARNTRNVSSTVGGGSASPILSPCLRGTSNEVAEGVNIVPQSLTFQVLSFIPLLS